MGVLKLKIKNFRNLSSVQLIPTPGFNLIFGDNGSGKTSVLEALYVLGFGRSFRCTKLNSAIKTNQMGLLSCAQIKHLDGAPFYLGLEKKQLGALQVKVAGEKVRSLVALTQHCPMLFVSPESFDLLTRGPEQRRKLIDWGAFHGISSFANTHQQFAKTLRQRNAFLKQRISDQSLKAWDHEYVRISEQVDQQRKQYLKMFIPCFQETLMQLMPIEGLSVDYWQGWSNTLSLTDALEESRAHDLRVGFSNVGPHRADLQISLYGFPADEILSRGQQKMLVCALYLAQGRLLADSLKKETIYLIDDLSAELDIHHRKHFLGMLHDINAQCFITGIEESLLLPLMKSYHFSSYTLKEGELSENIPSIALKSPELA